MKLPKIYPVDYIAVFLVIILTTFFVFKAFGAACSGARELVMTGVASYYGDMFDGRQTASGAYYDKHAYTAAHKRLAFGTRVKVTNLENGRSALVTINDRGPMVSGRIIDVSRRAAEDLDFIHKGLVKVRLEVVRREPP